MHTRYKDIILWGHSLVDYSEMFTLSDADLNGKILDCCSGPGSFNAELTKRGGHVISCDPLYNLSLEAITEKIDHVFSDMISIVTANKDRFIWTTVHSPAELALHRKENIKIFLADYLKGLGEGRYQAAQLPNLPYQSYEFDLALCSHYLFAHSPDQSIDFHVTSIKNLCAIAREVRIFPLLDSLGEIPSIVGPVMQTLNQENYGIEIKAAPYQFQKKGNAMMRVWAQTCKV